MGKKVKEYKSGDFIFAKVKGYPAWPARVQRLNGKKYFVYFYGTGETANLPPTMIFDYAENKDKFLTKTVKRRDFNDGVKQIEHDFANNVPLDQVVGLSLAIPEEGTANNTMNDSAIETADDSMAVDTTLEETLTEENTPQNMGVEDSDDTGALIIDEGKQKPRKSTAKTPAKEAPKAKEPKTPRGRGKKEESEETKEEDKKEEEIVSRSGRKIRPKRYLDEHTEENTTLPSPAPKKRRGASPVADKEKKEVKETEDKSTKQFNTVPQSELEDLKEPFSQADAERENILIAYLPTGEYVGIKLFQSRPSSFKNEASRLQWDKQSAANAITLKTQLERGQISAHSILTQLVMDLNLTEEEKATLDKERETEEKKSRVQFLKTEMKLIELDAKIKTCLCLEKADTELCLKLLDELMDLDVKPLMLLKHPSCLETVKRMRAYVGNTPSWDLSESAVLLFSQHAHRIRRQADTLYTRTKGLFTVPDGLSFWEYFTERVAHFKKVTAKLSSDELLEMVHEPIEMSMPASYTMRAAIDAANEEDASEDDTKKKQQPKAKKAVNSISSKSPIKRQTSKKQEENKKQEEKEEVNIEPQEPEEPKEPTDKESESTEKDIGTDTPKEKEITEDKEVKKDSKDKKRQNSEEKDVKKDAKDKKSQNSEEKDIKKDGKDKKSKTVDDKETKKSSDKKRPSTDDSESKKDSSKEKRTSIDEKSKKDGDKSNSIEENNDSDTKKDDKSSSDAGKKVNDRKESTEQKETENSIEEKGEKEKVKDKEDEPKAKRSRESKKTEPPPPRSPMKRKSKF